MHCFKCKIIKKIAGLGDGMGRPLCKSLYNLIRLLCIRCENVPPCIKACRILLIQLHSVQLNIIGSSGRLIKAG